MADHKIILFSIGIFYLSFSSPIYAGQKIAPELLNEVRLIIISTKTTASSILSEKKKYSHVIPETQIIFSDECSNLKSGLFFLVSDMITQPEKEKGKLKIAKSKIKDAYARKCQIKNKGMLDLGLPVIHPSIEKVPDSAVNWDDSDRVSELKHVAGLGYFLVERHYMSNDPGMTEGRLQSIYYFKIDSKQKLLLQRHCWDFNNVKNENNYFVFHCATEMAADHFMHSSFVYDAKILKLIHVSEYCRNPELIKPNSMRCKAESVNANAELILKDKVVSLLN